MMVRYFVIFCMFVFCLFVIPAESQMARFKHADRNKDGRVDRKEKVMENRWENAHQHGDANTGGKGVYSAGEKPETPAAKVDTSLEKKFDSNGDGWMNAYENNELLKYKYRMVQANGRTRVETDAEKLYDTNNDGYINIEEAEVMKEDLR